MNAPETIEATPVVVDSTALAIRQSIEQINGALTEFDKITAGLADLEKAHPSNLACNVDTPKGMKEAIAGRAAWRDPRIAVEKARKAGKAPVLTLGRDIDKRAAYLTDKLVAGESNYDEQIKAEEARKQAERDRLAAEEARRAANHQRRIAEISAILTADNDTVQAIELHIKQVVSIAVGADFEEFQAQAEQVHADTLAALRRMLRLAIEREAEAARVIAERAELERLRAEQAERDRAERARVAAEQRAEADRLAVERRQLAAEQAASRAEQARLDAEAAAQRQRADREAAAQRAEADRIAREAREAEQHRLDVELAALLREHREAAEAARLAEEARCWAEQQVREAAPLMLAALRQWQACDQIDDTKKQRAALSEAKKARDIAIAAAMA